MTDEKNNLQVHKTSSHIIPYSADLPALYTRPIDEPALRRYPAWASCVNGQRVLALAARQGELWCATSGGVLRWKWGPNIHYTWFGSEHGLPGTPFEHIALDGQGYPWVAGKNQGVSYWTEDGWQQFTTDSNLPSQCVLSLTVDPYGGLWISTDRGLGRVEWKDRKPSWRVYDLSIVGLPAAQVSCLAFDTADRMCLGTSWGLYVHDGDTWKRYTLVDGLPTNRASSLACAHDRSIWIGTPRGLACIKEDGRIVTATYTGAVYALAFDPRQNIILAATSEGLWVCQGDSVKHQEDPALEGAGRLCAITVGSDKYWIGSEIGVLEYGTGPTLVRTPGEQDLPEATITCLAMDGQNRLWAGTASGVWTFDNHKWLHLQPPGSLTTPIVNVNQIVNTPGDIVWLGSWQAGREGGLRRFRSSVELPLARPGAPRTVDALALDTAGQLWVASGENLFRQVDATWQTQPGPDANKLFLCLLSDRNNQLWCGMKGCLYFQEGAGWLKILDQHDILAVAEDAEGVIWIGTSQGLYTYKSKKLKAADIHLPSSRVQALCLTGTDIWIGTAAGLVRLKQGQASYWDPGNSGLVGPSIKALALGADNILWVGTNLGVCQFKFMEE